MPRSDQLERSSAAILAVVLWVGGLAIAVARIWLTAGQVFMDVRFAPNLTSDMISGYINDSLILVKYLAAACALFAAGRGVMLAYEGMACIRVLAQDEGDHGYLRLAVVPLAVSRGMLWIYRALLRFRNPGGFEEAEE